MANKRLKQLKAIDIAPKFASISKSFRESYFMTPFYPYAEANSRDSTFSLTSFLSGKALAERCFAIAAVISPRQNKTQKE